MNISRTPTLAFSAVLTLLHSASAPAADYAQSVTADAPVAYYRFNETNSTRPNINTNTGSLGAPGNATNLNVRSFTGAIVGDGRRAQFFDQTARAIVPFRPELNPDNTKPFTVEVWAYPASDQINGGQALINNRYAYSGVDRQGWVIFQRSPNDTYASKPGNEGIGWNFRMYRGSGGSSGLDVTSQKPYQVGQWTHIVVVYDPVTPNDATLNMYINGELANTAVWNDETNPGYVANTDNHGAQAVNGPAGISFGAYNNTAVDANGQTSQSNPYFGGIDEFAFYTNKLDEATILAHYKNGTNSARATPYSTMVKADGAVEYLAFEEIPPASGTLLNMGDLRSNGPLTINNKVQLNAPSPLQGEWKDRSIATHRRAGGGSRANMPFHVENNPTEDKPLTVELWVRPQLDRINPGAAVINNRKAAGNRSGWVIFQRAPNETYPNTEGVGWNFRMYTGSGSSGGADITTKVPYTVGEWQHLVFTWLPEADTGNGNWSGTLIAYVNGSPILPGEDPTATNLVSGVYHANTDPTDDGTALADLAIGSYNAASNWGQEFDGDMDEVAIYNNWALTPEQVAAHYAAGTNSHPSTVGAPPSVVDADGYTTNYASLVFSAPFNGLVDANGGDPTAASQRIGPATYLRFNDTPPYPAANSGSAGWIADAVAEGSATPYAAGAPGAGLGTPNNAVAFDGTNAWVSILSVPALEFSGQITLEAWILPSAQQAETARIISHGPALLTLFPPGTANEPTENGSIFTSPEVYLQIDNTGANYTVGSSDGTNTFSATAAVPAGDLTANQWVHLAGTFDGANWKLYRNGALLATSAATTGALPVPNGDWAIGSAGEGWEQLFNGSIDEPSIYNKALTAAQIAAHYTAATTGGGGDLTIRVTGHTATTITLSWTGATGKFLIQKKTDIASASWSNVATTTANSITLPITGTTGFYRVQSNYTGPDIP